MKIKYGKKWLEVKEVCIKCKENEGYFLINQEKNKKKECDQFNFKYKNDENNKYLMSINSCFYSGKFNVTIENK